MGESKQSKAAETLYNEIGGMSSQVKNRFDNYQDPHSFGDISSQIGDVYSGYEDMINRDTAEQIAKQQEGAGSSLASRGITSGSILTDTQSGIASNVNKSKANALSQLGIGKSGALSNLMQYFNQLGLTKTKAATDVDFGNIGNLFKKYGMQGDALGGLDDDTWFDDVLGVTSAVGNLAQGVGSVATGFGLGGGKK